MASLSAKQRGIFSSFLMPLCEETVLGPGPGPVFPASVSEILMRISHHFSSEFPDFISTSMYPT